MGHPAAALVWLAGALAARGDGIEPGAIVLSGGLTASVPLQARGVGRPRSSTGSARSGCTADEPKERLDGRGDRSSPTACTSPPATTRRCCARWRRAGLRYRVGCKRGGCGICKVQLKLGEVRYERPIADSVLSDDERVEGICLSCRAVPITNIVIELQEGDRLQAGPRIRLPELDQASGAVGDRSRSEEGRKGQSDG